MEITNDLRLPGRTAVDGLQQNTRLAQGATCRNQNADPAAKRNQVVSYNNTENVHAKSDCRKVMPASSSATSAKSQWYRLMAPSMSTKASSGSNSTKTDNARAISSAKASETSGAHTRLMGASRQKVSIPGQPLNQ